MDLERMVLEPIDGGPDLLGTLFRHDGVTPDGPDSIDLDPLGGGPDGLWPDGHGPNSFATVYM